MTRRPTDDASPPAPPVNYEAEQALLAALLADNGVYERVCERVRAEDFADPVHGEIFAAIGRLIDRGHTANAITLRNLFDRDDRLEDVGGSQYLADLQAALITTANAGSYANLVRDLSTRRRLMVWATEVQNTAGTVADDDTGQSLVERLESQLTSIAEATSASERGLQPVGYYTDHARDQLQEAFLAAGDGGAAGIATGYPSLDEYLHGLFRGHVTVIAGRPGMGKTALGENIAENAAASGYTTAFFSIEMPAEELLYRSAARATGTNLTSIIRGDMDATTYQEVDGAIQAHNANEHLWVDDSGDRTVAAIRNRARRLQRRHGLDVLVIDYLQLMRGDRRHDKRVDEIGEITGNLKTLAKELRISIVLLCQLNRELERRPDKRPQLADLRDGGTIEQDADRVIFLYREYEYIKNATPQQKDGEDEEAYDKRYRDWVDRMTRLYDQAEAIIAKHRMGATGTVHLRFVAEYTAFEEQES